MAKIANPTYDAVFKYLMQDVRVAKLLLKIVLQVESIEELIVKNNEFVVINTDELKLTRVDYQARIVPKNGEPQLVTIELQKAFQDTQVKRFRKYLGQHYTNSENYEDIEEKNNNNQNIQLKQRPLHIIQIYLLGHKLENLNSSIVRSQVKYVNVDGKIVENAEKEWFLKGLMHDMIVVQIPLLPEKPKNKVEEILSIFNHKKILTQDGHIVEINNYDDKSEEYKIIARRLQEAIVDDQVRKQMEYEDEVREEAEYQARNAQLRYEAGVEKGRAEGRAEGREEGREEERTKAYQDKLEMAKKMKSMNMSIEQISVVTGLSKNEIENCN